MIVTDPNKRCKYCNGRNVVVINDLREEIVSESLALIDGSWRCKDVVECKKNQLANNSTVKFSIENDKVKITEINIGDKNEL